MRILHLVHQYPPDDLGGTELYTRQLAAAQQSRDHSVGIFYRRSGEGAELEQWQEKSGATVWAARHGRVTPAGRLRTLFGDSVLESQWRSVLDTFRPDLVHVQHLMGLPAALLETLDRRDIPYVITFHDYWWACANGQLLTNYGQERCDGPAWWINCGRCALARAGLGALQPLAPLAAPPLALRQRKLTPLLASAQRLIAPTRFVRDIYAGLGLPVDHCDVVLHGIPVPAVLPERTRPLPPPLPLELIYVGGIARQKGLHVLIEAVNRLPPDALRLTIYGSLDTFPEYSAALRAAATHPGIALAGRLPHVRIWSALAEADAVVMPTLWYEASPLIAQEAFAVGTPVIGSDIGALPERVTHGENGLLVPVGDPSAWEATLHALINRPLRLAELRRGIPPIVTIDQHVDAVQAVYRDIVPAKK
jgi:glycosyltransferase involved in cell wall biosynthesis